MQRTPQDRDPLRLKEFQIAGHLLDVLEDELILPGSFLKGTDDAEGSLITVEVIAGEIARLALRPVRFRIGDVPVPHEGDETVVLPLLLGCGDVAVIHNPIPAGRGRRILQEDIIISGQGGMLPGLLENLVDPVIVVGRSTGLHAAQDLRAGLLAEEGIDLFRSGAGLAIGQVLVNPGRRHRLRLLGGRLLDGDGLGKASGGDGKRRRALLVGRVLLDCQTVSDFEIAVSTVFNGNPVGHPGNLGPGRGRDGKREVATRGHRLEGGGAEGDVLGRVVHRVRFLHRVLLAGPEEYCQGSGQDMQVSFHSHIFRFFASLSITKWNPEGGSAPSGLKVSR